MLAAAYRKDRNIRRMTGAIWFVSTREGLIGLRRWLIEAAQPDTPDVSQIPAEDTAEAQPSLSAADQAQHYGKWLQRFDVQRDQELAAAQRHFATLALPELMILAVVTPRSVAEAARMVAGWEASLHGGWRATFLASAGLAADEMAALRASAATNPRIGVAAAVAEVEAAWQCCDYTLLCFDGPLLNPLSTAMLVEAATRTGADIVYSDHDLIDPSGSRSAPAFKPQFSPEYLARYNYIGDCLLVSRSVPLPPGGAEAVLQATIAGYDRLMARLTVGRQVEHLPFILFHTPAERPRTVHDLPVIADTGPSVAIIIPTRDGLGHLRPCVESILDRTAYDLGRVQIVVVDNNSVEPDTLAYLDAIATRSNVSVCRYPHPFNFAAINNFGAAATGQDVIVFLNDDTAVVDPAWLSKLVWHAKQPGVGVVGGKLLFPDGTIQHGGCVAGGSMGTVQHLLSHASPAETAADHTREMSLITGACMAVRRDVFQDIGGFDPILRITWNDAKICLQCLTSGLRNIYVSDPLLTHDESKTRGQDDTRDRYIRYFSEADYTRRRFRDYFYDDPSYNPNLSLEQVGELAEPPRIRRPWSRPADGKLRILLLSSVYQIGFGVAVVIDQHVRKLTALGYDVILGGPKRDNEFAFPGCERVLLASVKEAAIFAFTRDVALVVSHTPPFFELPVLLGGHIPMLAYDYGEPAAEFFPEPTRSYLLEVGYQKRRAAALTTMIATISQAVKDETLNKDALVLGLANSHLPAWSEAFRPDRERVRDAHGWNGHFVVLTVSRFHENERAYKGLPKLAAILREFPYLAPASSRPVIWVLAGGGTPEDVAQVDELGFTVFPNVSDAMLADLYKAADAYMSFSRWEGYNLGISQALAMGLPTIASDIPAHREFGIVTTDSTLVACDWLAGQIGLRVADTPARKATVFDWEDSTTAFATVVAAMLRQSAHQPPRSGASGRVWHDCAA